jgi:hypothetical protein
MDEKVVFLSGQVGRLYRLGEEPPGGLRGFNALGKFMKIALVTPYFNEPIETLKRCRRSVEEQSVSVTHYMVADGKPNSELDDWDIRHIALPQNIGATGATPRGIGAIVAFAEGADAVAFLDADNWFFPDHIRDTTQALERDQLDMVYARRKIIFPDGEVLEQIDPEDGRLVDTNCYVFSRRASFLVAIWAMFPLEFGSGEDRMLPFIAHQMGLKTRFLDSPSVWYETNWPHHYNLAGKAPVASLRRPTNDLDKSFDPEIYRQWTGIRLLRLRRSEKAPLVPPEPRQGNRAALVTVIDQLSAKVVEQLYEKINANEDGFYHVIVGKAPPPDLVDEKLGVFFTLPYEGSDEFYLAQTIGVIFAFKLGFGVVALSSSKAGPDLEFLNEALSTPAFAGISTVVALARPVLPESKPAPQGEYQFDVGIVPKASAGQFVLNNLANHVNGFDKGALRNKTTG